MDYGKYSEGSGIPYSSHASISGRKLEQKYLLYQYGIWWVLDGDYYEGSEQLRYYTSDQADFEKLTR